MTRTRRILRLLGHIVIQTGKVARALVREAFRACRDIRVPDFRGTWYAMATSFVDGSRTGY